MVLIPIEDCIMVMGKTTGWSVELFYANGDSIEVYRGEGATPQEQKRDAEGMAEELQWWFDSRVEEARKNR